MTNNNNKWRFSKAFYVANTMEIFERLAWYGFFALSSLYMSTPKSEGGVEFTDMERGALQGIIPFFLYLLPVFTGALGDKWGYRKMFLLAFAIMTPGYYLLGQATEFGSFFFAFLLVAFGAACFKPVVVGTISHSSNDENRGLAFGIFYTMVNVGGFIGPLVAGYMRSISWDMVFAMSAFWIALNFIPALFFYRDPESVNKSNVNLKHIFLEAQQVLGNARFALSVFPLVVFLMIAGAGWWSYQSAGIASVVWLVFNWLWDKFAFKQSSTWYKQKIHISNKPFAVYLLLLTGFWTVYNQLFYTMPLYIRDFVDTSDLVDMLAIFGAGTVEFLAFVDQSLLTDKIQNLVSQSIPAQQAVAELVHQKVRVPVAEYQAVLDQFLIAGSLSTEQAQVIAASWADNYRQVNPEYLINLDFAAIIICQILVSLACQRFKTINVLVVGVLVFGVGLLTAILANSLLAGGMLAVMAILMMAFGEMITSPKSQEYVASIAPKNQAAMYMGYYFVSMALGFLFAGLLSGWGYGTVAKEMGQPELMWSGFAVLALITSIGLIWFNRQYIEKENQVSTSTASELSI